MPLAYAWNCRALGSGGWVAFDDVSVESKPLGSGRYYYFGGQRIAMMTASQVKYLHTDHLGSTYLVTNNEGNPVDNSLRCAAYGRVPSGHPIPAASLPCPPNMVSARPEDTRATTAARGRCDVHSFGRG